MVLNTRSNYNNGNLDKEKAELLNGLKFLWKQEETWARFYALLVEFKEMHPGRWPGHKEIFNDENLGGWCSTQRANFKNDKILIERQTLLDSINFPWDKSETKWLAHYDLLKQYRNANPDKWIKPGEKINNVNLGNWCATQEAVFMKGNYPKTKSNC